MSFDIGAYDLARPLTIDPGIQYASYLGGSGHDAIKSIAVDSDGNVYVGGDSVTLDFSGTSNFKRQSILYQFGFVTKFAPIVNGKTRLLYTIYLGDRRANNASRVQGTIVDH